MREIGEGRQLATNNVGAESDSCMDVEDAPSSVDSALRESPTPPKRRARTRERLAECLCSKKNKKMLYPALGSVVKKNNNNDKLIIKNIQVIATGIVLSQEVNKGAQQRSSKLGGLI